jgi:hypothetical protein
MSSASLVSSPPGSKSGSVPLFTCGLYGIVAGVDVDLYVAMVFLLSFGNGLERTHYAPWLFARITPWQGNILWSGPSEKSKVVTVILAMLRRMVQCFFGASQSRTYITIHEDSLGYP